MAALELYVWMPLGKSLSAETKTIQAENPLGTKPLGGLLRSLAVPAIIANVVTALYNIVDQIFIGQGVGKLGNAATAGCNFLPRIKCFL